MPIVEAGFIKALDALSPFSDTIRAELDEQLAQLSDGSDACLLDPRVVKVLAAVLVAQHDQAVIADAATHGVVNNGRLGNDRIEIEPWPWFIIFPLSNRQMQRFERFNGVLFATDCQPCCV